MRQQQFFNVHRNFSYILRDKLNVMKMEYFYFFLSYLSRTFVRESLCRCNTYTQTEDIFAKRGQRGPKAMEQTASRY